MKRVPPDWKGLSSVVLLDAGVWRDEHGVVHVPYRLAGGALHNEKLFARTRSWWATKGLPLLPFGLELVRDPDVCEGRLVWIAEGESDALALREHYAEWRNRPVDVIGLPGAGTWRHEWRRYVIGHDGVLVFPDGDDAGERMGQAIAKSIPYAVVVWMPRGLDVRYVIQNSGSAALDALIERAEWSALMLAGMRTCTSVDELERFLGEVTW